MLDGGLNVNIINEDLRKRLGLPISKATPYILGMANQTLTNPIGLIQYLKIYIHGIPYVVTFTMMRNNVLDANYSMLLARPSLRDAKVTHD